ncbi:hypothetical protein KEM56_007109 [Ascosphaera pollenicola]|nr:hypothetical protein KEM56_007109 [Ascosphaera pollenicola]
MAFQVQSGSLQTAEIRDSNIRNVAVFGGTGYIGKPIVRALANAGFTVSVFTRTTQADTSFFPESVNVVTYDITPESIVGLLKNQDAVVSALSSSAMDAQRYILDAVVEAGVRRFIPSEYSTDPRETVSSEIIPSFGKKKDFYSYLVENADMRRIEYTAIATGPFLDCMHLKNFWGFDATTRTATVWDAKRANVRIATTRIEDLAEAIAKVLSPELADRFANQTVSIHSATITLQSLLDAFEKATGSKWTLNHVDLHDELEAYAKRVREGDASALVPSVRNLLFEPGINSDFEQNTNGTDDVSKELGLPQADVEQLIQDFVQGQ